MRHGYFMLGRLLIEKQFPMNLRFISKLFRDEPFLIADKNREWHQGLNPVEGVIAFRSASTQPSSFCRPRR